MKKTLSFLIVILLSLSTSAISLEKVDSLIINKQYLSAWNALVELENGPQGVDTHIKKIDLSLKYFTKTFSHKLFSFTNLKKGQNLINLRVLAEKKMAQMYPYNIADIIDSLQKSNPTDYRLKKVQGDFYYDISILYGKDWIVNKQEVTRRMYEGYTTAEEHGIESHISLYALGYFWNLNEDAKKATNYFNRSLELDSTYAPTHYNLAYLYSEKDSLEAALYHAWQAYNLYSYLNYKNDAGQMAGSILGKLNRHDEAITLLLDCDKLIPNTYYTYYYLLNSFLSKRRVVESQVTAHNMFNLDWKSHTINTDIIKLFIQNDQLIALEQFYNDRLEEEKFDKEYRGYAYLHLAQAYHMKSKTEEALINVALAQENFNVCYDPGHPVFQVIEKMKR
jgi:tetratricopeptide (TPR) repeat protein